MSHEGPERRRSVTLSEEDVDEFIDRAIERATERVFAEVGRAVLTKLAWAVGVMLIGLFVWGKNKGWW